MSQPRPEATIVPTSESLRESVCVSERGGPRGCLLKCMPFLTVKTTWK